MERRRATRRTLAADEPLAHAKLRTGGQLVVLDASSWGVLIETTARLLPGRHVDVHIVTSSGRTLVRGRVARAFVYRLQPDAICYRAGLAFDEQLDTRACAYSPPVALATPPTNQGLPERDRSGHSDIVFSDRFIA